MTDMAEDFWVDRSQNNGEFMKLFRYIQGANADSKYLAYAYIILVHEFHVYNDLNTITK